MSFPCDLPKTPSPHPMTAMSGHNRETLSHSSIGTATASIIRNSQRKSSATMTCESALALSTIRSLHSALTQLRYKLPTPPSMPDTESTAIDGSQLKSMIGGWLHSSINSIGQVRSAATKQTRFEKTGVDIGPTTSDADAASKLYKLLGFEDLTVTQKHAQTQADLLVTALEKDVEFVRKWEAVQSVKNTSERPSRGAVSTTKGEPSRPRSSRSNRCNSGRNRSSRFPSMATVLGVGAVTALTAWGIHQWYTSGED